MTLIAWFYVACGGFLGAILRFHITKKLNTENAYYPIGTWLVNVIGSFAIGLLTALSIGFEWKLFLIAGGLGAFTTYSTVQKELLKLWQQGYKGQCILYGLWTYGGGLCCVVIGYTIGHAL